jgi:hypothetical protein
MEKKQDSFTNKKSFVDQIALLNEAIKMEKRYQSINNKFQLNVKKCKFVVL